MGDVDVHAPCVKLGRVDRIVDVRLYACHGPVGSPALAEAVVERARQQRRHPDPRPAASRP